MFFTFFYLIEFIYLSNYFVSLVDLINGWLNYDFLSILFDKESLIDIFFKIDLLLNMTRNSVIDSYIPI